jgi:site-specific recombinase XerD
MHHFTPRELLDLLTTTHRHSRIHHLLMLVSVAHGLRVSEAIALTVDDVQHGYLRCNRLKGSRQQLQRLHTSANPVLDESALAIHAGMLRNAGQTRLFNLSRQRCDQLIRRYGAEAGIATEKLHWHTFKHTTALLVFGESVSLGQVQQILGHQDVRSTLMYLSEYDAQKAIESRDRALNAVARIPLYT